MKILMTAFEPFGLNNFNSTITALEQLNTPNVDKIILPVAYPDAFIEFSKQIKKDYKLIILLGMAASREIVTIEERGVNELNFKIPDNNNLILNNQPITKNGENYIYSAIDIDELILYLHNLNFNIEKSSDAGKYICNYLYYKVLETYDTKSIFIHIPPYKDESDYIQLNNLLNEIIKYFEI